MQILATTGEENKNIRLNLISGNVKKFKPIKEDTPIPHITMKSKSIIKLRTNFNSFNKKRFILYIVIISIQRIKMML